MKKKIASAVIIGTMCAAMAFAGGCGSTGSDQTSQQASTQETETKETTQAEEQKEEKSEYPKTVEENGMKKEIYYENDKPGITGETGPIKYSIDRIQVSNVTIESDDEAQVYGLEGEKPSCMVLVDLSAENTSDDTVDFYAGQAVLTSDTKEQVEPDLWASDYAEGQYLGKVKTSGSNIYFLKNSDAKDVKNITLHMDAPSDENLNDLGNDVEINIDLTK